MITIVPGGGGGDVTGPASSTDNAIVRFDAATGKLLQNSTVTISDTGNVSVGASNSLVFGVSGQISYGDLVGPLFTDVSGSGVSLVLNIQGLTATRTATWPDAAGTVTLGGNTFTGTGSVVRDTSPTLGSGVTLGGGLKFLGFTTSAAAASTTEYPADKNCGFHKNTTTGVTSIALNDGGAIRLVAMV